MGVFQIEKEPYLQFITPFTINPIHNLPLCLYGDLSILFFPMGIGPSPLVISLRQNPL
jgi:hypothetical protein